MFADTVNKLADRSNLSVSMMDLIQSASRTTLP